MVRRYISRYSVLLLLSYVCLHVIIILYFYFVFLYFVIIYLSKINLKHLDLVVDVHCLKKFIFFFYVYYSYNLTSLRLLRFAISVHLFRFLCITEDDPCSVVHCIAYILGGLYVCLEGARLLDLSDLYVVW